MTHLNEGEKAPSFQYYSSDGQLISSDNLRGKKVVLYFYPKDNTPGCTAEACNLRDNYDILRDKGFEVIGVSPDSEKSHQKFAAKHDLPFSLIADIEKKLMNDYGVWGEKKMFGKVKEGVHRTTFVINENGVIEKIIKKVKTKDHAAQILEELEK